ncbi:TraE/TraK family type IV conjugative transfer system protein [Photobacterium ganghwense]|uniref:TraE/TraK family type IV conjugative transfer system protein n=1 Tax=Photobacterium ganghwense TaxID=320778 RepID=UPI001A8EEB27|nr:TraE/TraK family type IV conjugative transfer system protein [Photobacterium ganghwense]QSV17593.1 pilus assembly protein [Photobacterium ganghwense]
MKWKDYLKTWEGTQKENIFNRFVILALSIALVIAIMVMSSKRPVAIVQPFTLKQEAWVAESSASQNYMEAMGLAFSLLLGNVTPGSLDFIKERIEPFLSPEIYFDVVNIIDDTATQIRADRIVTRFEPRQVLFEEETLKVFINGNSFIRSNNSDEKRVERSYEFHIEVNNYVPMIMHMDTYTGGPRTTKVLNRMKNKGKEEK